MIQKRINPSTNVMILSFQRKSNTTAALSKIKEKENAQLV
jgi:hypothetical protein